jgi:hypothetical protein
LTRIILAISAVVLAACTGAPALAEPEPRFGVPTPASVAGQSYSAEATYNAAQAQRNAAELAAIEATAQAVAVTANAQATIAERDARTTATAQHLAALQAQDAATAQAGQATRDAETTKTAAILAQAGTREALAAIQQERELETIRQENITQRAEVKAWAFTAIVVVFAVALAVVVVRGLELLFRAKAFAQLAKATPGGVMTLANSRLEYEPRLLPAPVIEGDLLTEIGEVGAIPYTANGQEQAPITTSRDSNPERTNRALTTWLLTEARNYLDRTGGERNPRPHRRRTQCHTRPSALVAERRRLVACGGASQGQRRSVHGAPEGHVFL